MMMESRIVRSIEDEKIVKLVKVGSSSRIVSLKGKLLKMIGLDTTKELYGRWKIVETEDGKKHLVLEILPS